MNCKNCGKAFEGHKRTFCTRQCCGRFRRRKRSGLDVSIYEPIRPPARDHKMVIGCKSCGSKFKSRSSGNDGDERTKFCSRECGGKSLSKTARSIREVKALKNMGRDAKQNAINRKKAFISKYHKVALMYHCRECGAFLEQVSAQCCRNYCEICSKRTKEQREGTERYKANKREKNRIYRRKGRREGTIPQGNDKARAKHHRVEYENIKRKVVFDIYNWKCAKCGVDTPKELKGTKDQHAPELDHIVPISKGGPHTYSNVQLLCNGCNAVKSDTVEVRKVG